MASSNNYQKINTFVFFDLETTGLIRSSRMPRIIELAMIATSRDTIKPDHRNKLALPRILHKLCIPICPMQSISSEASYISNLWNDALENVKPFDKCTFDMIMQFIDRLPGVVCFVAHNGKRFDYPVFLSELERIQETIPDKILCVDSLNTFQEFFSDRQSVTPQLPVETIPIGRDEVDEEVTVLESAKSGMSISEDSWNDALYSVLDEFTPNEKRAISPSKGGKDVLDSISHKPQNIGLSPKSMQAVNESTPKNQIIRNSKMPISANSNFFLSNVRKQLNFGDNKPKNFKLGTIYAHMIGNEPENQHHAESDCINMLICACQIGHHFAEWADRNAVSLNLYKNKENPSAS